MRVKSDDAEIYYDVMGSGPAVVLLHAFPTNHNLWKPVAEVLATRYRVVLPDLRGHGQSGTGEGPAIMARHVADLRRVLDDAGVDRAIFAGVSIGGYVLFEVWRSMRERIVRLLLCNTKAQADTPEARAGRLKASDDVLRHGADRFLDGMIPKVLGATTCTNRPDLVAQVREMMATATVRGIAAVQRGMAERPDSSNTLKTISVPTMVLAGEEDVATPRADAEFMCSHIPNSRLTVLPRCGHLAVFEQAAEAAREIRKFLDEN